MKAISPVALFVTVALPLALACACGGEPKSGAAGMDIAASYERFRTNAANDRIEMADRVLDDLRSRIAAAKTADLTTLRIKELMGKPDKEVETIQTDGNLLVWRYLYGEKSKEKGQYMRIDALVLKFKGDVLVEVAKQKGWIPKGE